MHLRLCRQRTMGRLALTVALMALSTLLPASIAAADPINTPPPDCAASFDPYAYTQSAIASCGYATYPLLSVTPLPNGGSSYNYEVDGADIHVYVPPSSFTPTSATDAQLDEYGFPPRPSDPTELQQWEDEFASWTGAATPPAFLTDSNATNDIGIADDHTTTPNWSGYALEGSKGTYNWAETTFFEPTRYSSVCSTYAETTWAGIGGLTLNGNPGGPLAQDGTYLGNAVGNTDNHQAWYQIVPQMKSWQPLPFHATAGVKFDASTRWLGNGYYRFFMYNSNTSWSQDVHSTVGYGGNTAEAIAERPTVNNKYTNLTNFDSLTFSWAKANDVGFDKYSPSGVRWALNMFDGSQNMAVPSEIGNIGYFTDDQHHCN